MAVLVLYTSLALSPARPRVCACRARSAVWCDAPLVPLAPPLRYGQSVCESTWERTPTPLFYHSPCAARP
jgi:hypothetical protein